ncbi:hypothetical protein K8Z61_02430 [Nocardioides sp. TRM66260-LWL]|uniref:hypothetical protein n=1 Tax=Nocardioides sp. TRM66260-LWL TaxID=2874478 RepID=UPI001CC71439|nr:hypothetical protein [Nocardioides sp. TRM66260-LWL]MBZ5733342.1 hypothetical protein [Nocardioides sp. TRM66260-LWL]
MSDRMTTAGLARALPRVAETAVERARLRVVPRTRRATRVPFVSLVTVLLLGGVVGLLFFNTSMQQTSFTISRLQDQATYLDAQQESLQMDLQRLQDPQTIARRAQAMGLTIPAAPLFLELGSGRVVGDRSAATTRDKVQLEPAPPTLPSALVPQRRVVVVPPPEGVLPREASRGAQRRTGSGR